MKIALRRLPIFSLMGLFIVDWTGVCWADVMGQPDVSLCDKLSTLPLAFVQIKPTAAAWGEEPSCEYILLQNEGAQAVNLAGCTLVSGRRKFLLQEVRVPVGGTVCFVHEDAVIKGSHALLYRLPNVHFIPDKEFTIALLDKDGALVSLVDSRHTPWRSFTKKEGLLVRTLPYRRFTPAAQWVVHTSQGVMNEEETIKPSVCRMALLDSLTLRIESNTPLSPESIREYGAVLCNSNEVSVNTMEGSNYLRTWTLRAHNWVFRQGKMLQSCTVCVHTGDGDTLRYEDYPVACVLPWQQKNALWLSEILFSPQRTGEGYIEVWNASNYSVPLEEWYLVAPKKRARPLGSADQPYLLPGARMLLVENKSAFHEAWGSVSCLVHELKGAAWPLKKRGGSLSLHHEHMGCVDSVQYTLFLDLQEFVENSGVAWERYFVWRKGNWRDGGWYAVGGVGKKGSPGVNNHVQMLQKNSEKLRKIRMYRDASGEYRFTVSCAEGMRARVGVATLWGCILDEREVYFPFEGEYVYKWHAGATPHRGALCFFVYAYDEKGKLSSQGTVFYSE